MGVAASERGISRGIIGQEYKPVLDHCGVVAAFADKPIALFQTGLAGLHQLQTRGQDGAGVCVIDFEGQTKVHKGEGMIRDVFGDALQNEWSIVKAQAWGLQTRYGTNGGFNPDNVQPFTGSHSQSGEPFFVAHNGEFSARNGDDDATSSDTAKFTRRLAVAAGDDWDKRIINTLKDEHGAWSLIIGTANAIYLARDPYGVRPLSYGSVMDVSGTNIFIAASETAALEKMGVKTYYDVLPGEILRVDASGFNPIFSTQNDRKLSNGGLSACVFSGIYIESGDSKLHQPRTDRKEINSAPKVEEFRQKCGEILAKEAPLSTEEVDIAIGIPGTGITGGKVYADTLNIPYVQAITDLTPQDDPRTFMTADIDAILQKVLGHFNFNEQELRGKRVVLIDDSIVRGNIMKGLVELLKNKYGVTEVHIRVLSPMIDKGCYLGVNTRKDTELIARQQDRNVQKVCQILGANSLAYLSMDGLREALGQYADGYCYGCMAGHHPPIDRFGNSQIVFESALE